MFVPVPTSASPDVGQVRHLRVRADRGVLDLDVRAGTRALAEDGARSQEGEGADPCALADHGELGPGVDDLRARADLAGDAAWFPGRRRHRSRPRSGQRIVTWGRMTTSGSSSTSTSSQVDAGSRIETPARIHAALMRSRRMPAAWASCTRSLTPRISSGSSHRHGGDAIAVGAQEPDHVGEVLLALRVVGGEPRRGSRRGASAANAYMPELISSIRRWSSVASFSSTIAVTDPSAARTIRPYPCGSARRAVRTVAVAPVDSCSSSSPTRVRPGQQGRVAGEHDDGALGRRDPAPARSSARPAPRGPCRSAPPARR